MFEQPSVTFSGISDDPAVAAKQASASAIAKDSVNQHCAELHSWVQTAAHRVICPDNADCATKYERQARGCTLQGRTSEGGGCALGPGKSGAWQNKTRRRADKTFLR